MQRRASPHQSLRCFRRTRPEQSQPLGLLPRHRSPCRRWPLHNRRHLSARLSLQPLPRYHPPRVAVPSPAPAPAAAAWPRPACGGMRDRSICSTRRSRIGPSISTSCKASGPRSCSPAAATRAGRFRPISSMPMPVPRRRSSVGWQSGARRRLNCSIPKSRSRSRRRRFPCCACNRGSGTTKPDRIALRRDAQRAAGALGKVRAHASSWYAPPTEKGRPRRTALISCPSLRDQKFA